ncbi:MAG: histidine phosphatase family protein [Chloroflexota bacterium]
MSDGGARPGRTDRPDGTPLIPPGLDATLVLLRHGETEWIREGRFQGSAETPLSALGRRQAALAGERLARPHASPSMPVPGGLPREIVYSPLGRTAETAEAVRAAIADLGGGAPLPALVAEPGIREIGQGLWEGETTAEIQRRWPDELSGWRRDPLAWQAPGGERLAEVDARVRPALARALDELGRDYPRGTTDRPQVSGYHGVGALGAQPWSILVGHDGVFKVVMLALFDLPLEKFWSFSLGLTGISVVEFRGGRPTLRAFNLTGHLAPIEDEQAREAAERRAQTGAL